MGSKVAGLLGHREYGRFGCSSYPVAPNIPAWATSSSSLESVHFYDATNTFCFTGKGIQDVIAFSILPE